MCPLGVLDSLQLFFAKPQAFAFGIWVQPPNRTPTSMRQSSRIGCMSSYTSSFLSPGCCRQPRLIPTTTGPPVHRTWQREGSGGRRLERIVEQFPFGVIWLTSSDINSRSPGFGVSKPFKPLGFLEGAYPSIATHRCSPFETPNAQAPFICRSVVLCDLWTVWAETVHSRKRPFGPGSNGTLEECFLYNYKPVVFRVHGGLPWNIPLGPQLGP